MVYAVVIFLASFLLFQIEPLIAKIILPWFGGSSSVWTTCMLFFQVTLLLGYLYAHWLHEYLDARRQAVVHTLLLLASLALLPVAPTRFWKDAGGDPAAQIVLLLAAAIGLQFFLLSTTSPLLQAWYARTHAGAVPYRLFALSNFASMLALLSYPVLVEPNWTLRTQARAWSAAYAVFVVCGIAAAWRGSRAGVSKPAAVAAGDAPRPGRRLYALWAALPATASILLLALTNYITQDIAAIPFLWILPLSVYLLSFIVCFEAPRLYWRWGFLGLLVAALAVMGYMLSSERQEFGVFPAIALTTGVLFVISMVCHGELVRLKPHPRHLTAFYLMVSLGGALGGVFVGVVAPQIFRGYQELPAGLLLCALLAATVLLLEHRAFFRTATGRSCAIAMGLGVAAFAWVLGAAIHDDIGGCRVVARNFYGQLRVYDRDEDDGAGPRRKLVHGVINHGEQILDADYRRKPGTYFCPGTAIGQALLAGKPGVPRRIGILGLGCGTLAAYGRPGDLIRIYEINPLVFDLARTQFTYLSDTPAKVELVPGDGRLSLEREPAQHFDVLVMDAFSGDSVPVHLLTREAFRAYLRHLKPGGVLAVNISNKYLDLRPVVERAAAAFGKQAVYGSFKPADDDLQCFYASWVVVVDPGTRFPVGQPLKPHPGVPLWTDDYSSLRQILK